MLQIAKPWIGYDQLVILSRKILGVAGVDEVSSFEATPFIGKNPEGKWDSFRKTIGTP